MSLFAKYDGASRLSALFDGDFGETRFFRDGPGRVIARKLVNANGSQNRISQYNTRDLIERDAIGRIAGTEYWGSETGGFLYGEEEFHQDSVGRVHSERYRSVFAPTHWLINNTSYVGPNPYRSGLSYTDTLNGVPSAFEKANLSIGRLTEIGWDRAEGAGGAMAMLAKYDYAGEMRRQRDVRFKNTASGPRSQTVFQYDRFDRLLQIRDRVQPQVGLEFTASQFDYEYDQAHNLTKEKYAKVSGAAGDRFTYDAYHRLATAKMGCDTVAMGAGPGTVHETLTYGLDGVNNRTSVVSQQGSTQTTTGYGLQGGSHAQGASNRYDSLTVSGTSTTTFLKYDDRGNMTFDGRFYYRYDYLNRLQEVWKVKTVQPVDDGAMFAEVQGGSMEDAEESVKLEVPDVHTRVFREHADPVFRNRLRASIVGGVITVAPTSQGGGGRPGFVPNPASLELAAVYVYDAFNRRVASALADSTIGETRFHVWDEWRQASEHVLDMQSWQTQPTKQFVWGNGLDELVSYRRRVGPSGPWQTYFLLQGGQDTSAKLVDASGDVVEQYEYDAYGRMRCFSRVSGVWTPFLESRVGLPFQWKGVRLDEITGLLQMRHRYYSVDLGRFLTEDPLGVWADDVSLGSEYCYAGCNPLMLSDEFGLQSKKGPGTSGNGGDKKASALEKKIVDATSKRDAAIEKAEKMDRKAAEKNNPEMPKELGPDSNGDKEAGKFENVGKLDVGERDPKTGAGKKMPSGEDVAGGINPDWHFKLCYGNETAGVVMFDTMTGDIFIVREERNSSETPSSSVRLFCTAKATAVNRSAPHVKVVGGFHTHPSKGSTTDPSDQDKERIKEDHLPEIISNGKSIGVHKR
jgi:RHS repeat-associated protein